MHQTTLRYSEPLLRQAVRAFVIRSILRFGVKFFLACGVVGVCAGFLISHGDRSWVVGALAATLVFVGVIISLVYLAHYRYTVGSFREMRVPEATLSCDEEQFTIASELGSATLPWSSIAEIWRYPDFWLILFSRSQFTTLPLDCLDAEMQGLITRKCAKV